MSEHDIAYIIIGVSLKAQLIAAGKRGREYDHVGGGTDRSAVHLIAAGIEQAEGKVGVCRLEGEHMVVLPKLGNLNWSFANRWDGRQWLKDTR